MNVKLSDEELKFIKLRHECNKIVISKSGSFSQRACRLKNKKRCGFRRAGENYFPTEYLVLCCCRIAGALGKLLPEWRFSENSALLFACKQETIFFLFFGSSISLDVAFCVRRLFLRLYLHSNSRWIIDSTKIVLVLPERSRIEVSGTDSPASKVHGHLEKQKLFF